jgi:hypothetical protein
VLLIPQSTAQLGLILRQIRVDENVVNAFNTTYMDQSPSKDEIRRPKVKSASEHAARDLPRVFLLRSNLDGGQGCDWSESCKFGPPWILKGSMLLFLVCFVFSEVK